MGKTIRLGKRLIPCSHIIVFYSFEALSVKILSFQQNKVNIVRKNAYLASD